MKINATNRASIKICPKAILKPTAISFFNDWENVNKNKGPGIIAPESPVPSPITNNRSKLTAPFDYFYLGMTDFEMVVLHMTTVDPADFGWIS